MLVPKTKLMQATTTKKYFMQGQGAGKSMLLGEKNVTHPTA